MHSQTHLSVLLKFKSIRRASTFRCYSVWVPLVVSLSRMRKVPLALPLESSCLSASFRPNLPKYQLQGKKKKKKHHQTQRCNLCFKRVSYSLLVTCVPLSHSTKHREMSYPIFMTRSLPMKLLRLQHWVCVCEGVCLCIKVLLTLQLGSSPQERRNYWECTQFHL